MTDKNMADVADKAVERVADGLGDLTDKVSVAVGKAFGGIEMAGKAIASAAPDLWRMVVNSNRTEGALDIGVAVLIVAKAAGLSLWLLPWLAPKNDFVTFVRCAAPVVGGFVALGFAYSGIHKFLNAEYWAARELLKEARTGTER